MIFQCVIARIVTRFRYADGVIHKINILPLERDDQEEKFRVIYNRFARNTFLEWLLDLLCKSENGPQFSDSEVIRAIARTWVCLPREKFSFLNVFAKEFLVIPK